MNWHNRAKFHDRFLRIRDCYGSRASFRVAILSHPRNSYLVFLVRSPRHSLPLLQPIVRRPPPSAQIKSESRYTAAVVWLRTGRHLERTLPTCHLPGVCAIGEAAGPRPPASIHLLLVEQLLGYGEPVAADAGRVRGNHRALS